MGLLRSFVRAMAARTTKATALMFIVVSFAAAPTWAQVPGPGPYIDQIYVNSVGVDLSQVRPPGGRRNYISNSTGGQQEFVLTRTRRGVTEEIWRVVNSGGSVVSNVMKSVSGDVIVFSTIGIPQWDRPINIVGNASIGVFSPATSAWFLKNEQSPGPADTAFTFGPAGAAFIAFAGDWNGDGYSTPGLYDPATGAVFLKNTFEPGEAHYVFTYGPGGNTLTALAGDWDGDGLDSIGLYDAVTGAFFLRNGRTSGAADIVFTFGAGDSRYSPIAGDWNGDGIDTVGLYDATTGNFLLRDSNTPGPTDLLYGFGPAGMVPVVGDWNGDGIDTVGVYSPTTGTWFIRNSHEPGPADAAFSYGPEGSVPIAGNWVAIYQSASSFEAKTYGDRLAREAQSR